jgi:hypothetical protein
MSKLLGFSAEDVHRQGLGLGARAGEAAVPSLTLRVVTFPVPGARILVPDAARRDIEQSIVVEVAHADSFAAEGPVERGLLEAHFAGVPSAAGLVGYGKRRDVRRQERQLQVFEPDFRFAAGVKLQADDAPGGPLPDRRDRRTGCR